jgi:tRNA (mo5U34)-methyltransferase
MEHRGAAEVVAADLSDPARWDWPGGGRHRAAGEQASAGAAERFEHARRALGSEVVRRELSVYELAPDAVGTFDVVHCGSLVVHLRDPVAALAAVRTVCTGLLVLHDTVDLPLALLRPRTPSAVLDGDGRPSWWRVNPAGLARVAEAAGFDVVEGPTRLSMPRGAGARSRRRRATPHAAVLARPLHSARS